MTITIRGRLRRIGKKLKDEVNFYRLVMKDERTPLTAKLLLWAALTYLFLPFDIIPDFIPIIGHLDDVIIIPLLIFLAMRMVPAGVIMDCRHGSMG